MLTDNMLPLNLELFGDGAGGASGASGVSGASAAGQGDAASGNSGDMGDTAKKGKSAPKAGKASRSAGGNENEETFQSLVKGRFKEDYSRNVEDIVTKRLKNSKHSDEALERLSPVLKTLGEKYGIDVSDPGNIDVAELSQRMAGAEAEKGRIRGERIASIVDEGQRLTRQYPAFDLSTELKNPEFARMVWAGVPMQKAYETAHSGQILAGAMKYTARQVKQMVSDSIRSGGARPNENGLKPAPAAVTEEDVKSPSYRERIKERVRRGEKVYL